MLSSETFPASDIWAAGIMAYQLLSGGCWARCAFGLEKFVADGVRRGHGVLLQGLN